ncbi:MAG: hypothetical protein VSS52_003575, partial [Thiotrichaceae bacterium]|nr:hypothetical protein [Thiotrichaceae bacterium]
QIKAPSGHLYLATVGDIDKLNIHDFALTLLQGEINISQQSLLETSGESGGGISIRSGQFVLNNSQLIAQTQGQKNGDAIDITANDITLRQGALIDASVTGLGNGANIRLQATESISAIDENETTGNSITIYADAELNQAQNNQENQTGDAGTITLSANNIEFKDRSSIIAETSSTGRGADINMSAKQNLTFSGNGNGSTSGTLISKTNYKPETAGKAGNVFLSAEQILLEDEYNFTSSTYGFSNAGNIIFNTNNLNINSTLIATLTFGAGDAGLVHFDIDDTLSLYGARIFNLSMGSGNANTTQVKAKNIYFDYGSYFLSLNRRTGNAGNIIIEATDMLKMLGARNGYSSKIASNSSPTLEGLIAGDAGNISVKAGRIIMRDGANISSNSFSRLGFYAGKGGNIDIDVQGSIDISGANPYGESEEGFASGIYARSLGIGDNGSQGGNIRLQAQSLKLAEGAAITSSTNNYSPSGTIDIIVQDSIEMSGDASHIELLEPGEEQVKYFKTYSVNSLNQSTSGIYARSLDNNVQSGAAGNINLSAQTLNMSDKSSISTSSAGGGQAGHIKLTVNQLKIDSTAHISSESQFTNRYQFIDVDERDNTLVKQGDIIKAADLGNGKINYYINIGTYLIPSRIPIDPVADINALYQLSEQNLLVNGQIVEVKNADNQQSGQYIYTHHHDLELDTWQRMDQDVTTVLDTAQPILSVRKDNDGYAQGETLPNYQLGERIRVLDVGNGKTADFIYTNMQENNGNTHVDFVRVNQFNVSNIAELNILPEQTALDNEYPIATVENPQQGLIGQFIYADNQWISLNTQRQIAQITDINDLTLAKTGNIAKIGDANDQMIYTGQKWINLNPQLQTIQSIAD